MSCEPHAKSNNSDGNPMPNLLDGHLSVLVRQLLTRAEWESHKMLKFIAGMLADPPVEDEVVTSP
jgi:hypothetical protein